MHCFALLKQVAYLITTASYDNLVRQRPWGTLWRYSKVLLRVKDKRITKLVRSASLITTLECWLNAVWGNISFNSVKKGNTLFWWTLAKGIQWGPFQPVYTPFSPNIITDADMRNAYRSSSENQKGTDHLKDLEVDGTTMLKRVWRQYVETVDRIRQAKDGIQVGRHTNMAMNFQFCSWWVTSACQHGIRGAG